MRRRGADDPRLTYAGALEASIASALQVRRCAFSSEGLMGSVQAFVGHSFTSDDADLVNRFLAYFEQISNLNPEFSWINARSAEPKEVADKVMALLPGKNVFIGICTKREQVVSSLRSSLLHPGSFVVNEENLSWKTSDWVIQEIGLAIGRGLDLILLVEEGVRAPGTLQGNIEYIYFRRSHPEECFGKVLEMITALLSRMRGGQIPSNEELSSPEREPVEGRNTAFRDDDYFAPKPEWKLNDYEFAALDAVISDDREQLETVTRVLLGSHCIAEAGGEQGWAAYVEFTRLQLDKDGSLSRLKDIAEKSPDNSRAAEYLARGYDAKELFAEAGSEFLKAAELEHDSVRVIRLLGHAAASYVKSGNSKRADELAARIKSLPADVPTAEAQLLRTLYRVATEKKDRDRALAIMERMLEIEPDESYPRFSLAHQYSELGDNGLSLFHYLRISAAHRSAAAWNNLGVQFQRLKLPIKSVAAYRKAEELGESLAMSNLAEKFLSVGFSSEAEAECNRALAIKDYHPNVAAALSKLRSAPAEEDAIESKALENAKLKSTFLREFGRAVLAKDFPKGMLTFQGPNCTLKVSFEGAAFTATGSYELQDDLGGVMRTGGMVKSINRMDVAYTGLVEGRSITADVKRTRQVGGHVLPLSLLGFPQDTPALIIVAEDARKMRVLENPYGEAAQFYDLIAMDNQKTSP